MRLNLLDYLISMQPNFVVNTAIDYLSYRHYSFISLIPISLLKLPLVIVYIYLYLSHNLCEYRHFYQPAQLTRKRPLNISLKRCNEITGDCLMMTWWLHYVTLRLFVTVVIVVTAVTAIICETFRRSLVSFLRHRRSSVSLGIC